jgi:YD repeat-containing protein
VVKVRDASGNIVSNTYTPDANISQYTDPLGNNTIFGFDTGTGHTNNLLSVTDGNGAKTAFSYTDSSDPYLPSTQQNPQNATTAYGYDNVGNLQTVTDTTQNGTGTSVTYAYNTDDYPYGSYLYGTLKTSTDGDGNPTNYSYDSYGNLHIITPPAPLKPETIGVDKASRVTSVLDGKGQLTSFLYDNLDRILQITYTNGRTIVYHYDNNGNVLSVKDDTGITSFSYDHDNRILTKSLPGGEVLTTGYDPVGNLHTYSDSGGKVSYDYYPNNQIKDIVEPEQGRPTTTFTYNKGQRQTETFPNGVVQSYSYDAANHITGIVATNSSDQTLITEQDSYQNPSSKAYSNLLQTQSYLVPNDPSNDTQSWSYSYDSMSRLTQADLEENG